MGFGRRRRSGADTSEMLVWEIVEVSSRLQITVTIGHLVVMDDGGREWKATRAVEGGRRFQMVGDGGGGKSTGGIVCGESSSGSYSDGRLRCLCVCWVFSRVETGVLQRVLRPVPLASMRSRRERKSKRSRSTGRGTRQVLRARCSISHEQQGQ